MVRNALATMGLLAGLTAGILSADAAIADAGAEDSLLNRALQAASARHDDEAARLLRQAHQLDPFDLAPLIALGKLSLRIGAAEEAAEFFRAALAIEGDSREARRGLADAFVDLDRVDDALAVYDILISQDAGDGRAWNGKGQALDLAGRHDEARAAFRAALAVTPDDPEVLANLELSRSLASAPAESATNPDTVTPDTVTLALNAGTAAAGGPVGRPHSVGRDP